jgi:hypothetical protein
MAEKRFGFLLENWEQAVKEAEAILIEKARQRQTITYGDLVAQIQSCHIETHGYAMGGLLRAVHQLDVAANRPGLATLVVRKSDGLPGPGYFADLGELDKNNYKDYWQANFDDLCAYWEKH